MNEKQKAKEIVNKIKDDLFNKRAVKITDEDAVLCALIAVDEILNSNPCYQDSDRGGNLMYYNNSFYWREVKNEIQKL